MAGTPAGGPGFVKGKSLDRKIQGEVARHEALLGGSIPDHTPEQASAVRAMIQRNSNSAEEAALFESMLLDPLL